MCCGWLNKHEQQNTEEENVYRRRRIDGAATKLFVTIVTACQPEHQSHTHIANSGVVAAGARSAGVKPDKKMNRFHSGKSCEGNQSKHDQSDQCDQCDSTAALLLLDLRGAPQGIIPCVLRSQYVAKILQTMVLPSCSGDVIRSQSLQPGTGGGATLSCSCSLICPPLSCPRPFFFNC